jgi:hypothetical protein
MALRCLTCLLSALLLIGWQSSACSEEKHIVTDHFIVDYDNVSEDLVKFVIRDAEQAFHDVTTFLRADFGTRKIRIQIGNQFPFPVTLVDQATIRIPASRLTTSGSQVGQERIRGRGMTFWHAVTPIILPSGQKPDNWARFLEHGLGGYLQGRFGNKEPTPWPSDVYPTMGEDVHPATEKLAAELGFLSLNDAVRQLNDRRLTRTRQLGWLEAASFVGYLVETRPLDQFMLWYEGRMFRDAYDVDIRAVEGQWMKFLERFKS